MSKRSPFFDLKKRPVSWSFISSFEWSPEQWFDTYMLGKRSSSKEMEFGSMVDKRIQEDPAFLPMLERYAIMQHPMKASLGDIPLIGYADHFDRAGFRVKDDKTGKKAWDQKRADDTGQLTMYCLLLWLTEKIPPEKLRLYIEWIPTKEAGDFSIQFRDKPVVPVIFETKRTMGDVLKFGNRIKTTLVAAEAYARKRQAELDTTMMVASFSA